MKKMFLILVVALMWGSQSFSQDKEVVYGTVRTDGYEKITKGAFWSERPEAKLIYEGGSVPPGCTVYTLTKDYFVRFIDTEHNAQDKNYIVFPKGEKVYTKAEKYFSAKCGNQIEYLRPVDTVKIIEKEKIISSNNKEEKNSSNNPEKIQVNNYYVSSRNRSYDDGYYGYSSGWSYYGGGYGSSLIRVNIGTGRSYYRGGYGGGSNYHRSYTTPTRTYNAGSRYPRSSGGPVGTSGHYSGGGNPYGAGGHSSGGGPAGARGHR